MRETPEIKTVGNGRFTMEYISFGGGEKKLVILPGLSVRSVLLSADGIAEAFAPFTEKYTVYLFDRKKDIRPGYSIDDMADDTAEAMRAAGIGSACVFGASQGGMTACSLLRRYPGLIGKAVICSATTEPDERLHRVIRKWIGLAESRKAAELNQSFTELVYSEAFREKFGSILRSEALYGSDEELAQFAAAAKACLLPGCSSTEKTGIPVLVTGSDSDAVMPADAIRRTAERLGAELYMYSDYGHAVYDEAPDFRERMLAFFERPTE